MWIGKIIDESKLVITQVVSSCHYLIHLLIFAILISLDIRNILRKLYLKKLSLALRDM